MTNRFLTVESNNVSFLTDGSQNIYAASLAARNFDDGKFIKANGNMLVSGDITISDVDLTGDLNITGGEYKIDTVSVLSSTTLGSNVINSSLTGLGSLSGLDMDGLMDVNRKNINLGLPADNVTLISDGTDTSFDNPFGNVEMISDTGKQLVLRPSTFDKNAEIELRGSQTTSTVDNTCNICFTNDDGGVNNIGKITGKVTNSTTNVGDIIFYNYQNGSTPRETMKLKNNSDIIMHNTYKASFLHLRSSVLGSTFCIDRAAITNEATIQLATNGTLKYLIGIDNSPASFQEDYVIKRSDNGLFPDFRVDHTNGDVYIHKTLIINSGKFGSDYDTTLGSHTICFNCEINGTQSSPYNYSFGGNTNTSGVGVVVPRNCTLQSVTWCVGSSSTFDLNIRRNGSVILNFGVIGGTAGSNNDLDIAVSLNGVMTVDLDSGTVTNGSVVTLIFVID